MATNDCGEPRSRAQTAEAYGLARIALAGLIWGSIPLVLRAADGASAIKVFYRVAFAGVALLILMAA
jgi:hypothetical protein